MKLALDAMGGDHAPREIVLGGLDALSQYDFLEKLYLVGKRDAIETVLKEAEKNQKIDYSKLTNYNEAAFDSKLMNLIAQDCPELSGYFVPSPTMIFSVSIKSSPFYLNFTAVPYAITSAAPAITDADA